MSLGIRNFVPMQKLGEGSFASVYKVKRNADSQIYALKKVTLPNLDQDKPAGSQSQRKCTQLSQTLGFPPVSLHYTLPLGFFRRIYLVSLHSDGVCRSGRPKS